MKERQLFFKRKRDFYEDFSSVLSPTSLEEGCFDDSVDLRVKRLTPRRSTSPPNEIPKSLLPQTLNKPIVLE